MKRSTLGIFACCLAAAVIAVPNTTPPTTPPLSQEHLDALHCIFSSTTLDTMKNISKITGRILQQLATTNYFSPDVVRFFRKAAFAPWLSDNFDTVQQGVLLRAAQPSAERFERYIHQYGIKTAVNLRDDITRTPLWHEINAVAHKNDVHLMSIPMSSKALPTPQAIHDLIKLYTVPTPKPILINCHHGRDRTGFASALFKLEIEHASLEEALKQFDFLRYGHIKKLFPCMQMGLMKWYEIRKLHPGNSPHALDAALAEYKKFYDTARTSCQVR